MCQERKTSRGAGPLLIGDTYRFLLRDSFLVIRVILSKIILAIAVSWMICAIITVAGGFPSDPSNPQYKARTDARIGVLKDAKWFRFPYPGKACP